MERFKYMKILLVNDCRFEGMILKGMLDNLGYSVKISDENNVFFQVDSYKPQCIISNLVMKETTGDKILSSIKEKNSNIRCILSSSSMNQLNKFQGVFDALIATPIKEETIEVILKNLLGEPKMSKRFCSFCGKRFKEGIDIKFCPFCGEKV